MFTGFNKYKIKEPMFANLEWDYTPTFLSTDGIIFVEI